MNRSVMNTVEVKVCLTEDVLQGLEHTTPTHGPDEGNPGCDIDDKNDPPPGALAPELSPQSSEEKEERELDSEQTGVESDSYSG